MGIFTYLSKLLLSKRLNNIFLFKKNAAKDQVKILKLLLKFGEKTDYGSRFKFDKISNYQDFNKHVPVVNYEEFFPEIQKTLKGKNNNICPGSIKWFAKSSGTTNDKSKFIPVSDISLKDNHFKAGKDLLSCYLNNNKSSKLFDGRSLALGGSKQITPFDDNQMIFTGEAEVPPYKPPEPKIPETPKVEPPVVPKAEVFICPTREQELKNPVGKILEGNKKIVAYEQVGKECLMVTEDLTIPDQIIGNIPNAGTVTTTASIAVVATTSALLAKPFADLLLRVVKPTVKKVIKKIASLRGKNVKNESVRERRSEQRQRNSAIRKLKGKE